MWAIDGLFKADVEVSMATKAGKTNLTVSAGIDLTDCQSRVCAFVKEIMGSYQFGAAGSISGFSFKTGSSGPGQLNVGPVSSDRSVDWIAVGLLLNQFLA